MTKLVRAFGFTMVTSLMMAALTPTGALADDLAIAKRDISSADDFRVRTSAALVLGRSHDRSSRAALERALNDSNISVRAAAAAALGALGDPAALPALERRSNTESSSSVKAQIAASVTSLTRLSTLQGVQLVVQIGSMRNASRSVRGEAVAQVLKSSAFAQAGSMSNVVVADAADSAMVTRAASRHVPIVAIDGTVLSLTQSQSGGATQLSAHVEFSIRRIPEQTLKAVLNGNATSSGQGNGPQAHVVAELEDRAVQAAVESALRGADRGMLLAAK